MTDHATSEAKALTLHLQTMGWEFYQTGPNEGDWLKFSKEGKLLGRAGDDVWEQDVELATVQMDSQTEDCGCSGANSCGTSGCGPASSASCSSPCSSSGSCKGGESCCKSS